MMIDAREAQVLERTRLERLDELVFRLERSCLSACQTRDETFDLSSVHGERKPTWSGFLEEENPNIIYSDRHDVRRDADARIVLLRSHHPRRIRLASVLPGVPLYET